jgi:hypothetical protein
MNVLKTKRTETYFALTLGKGTGSLALPLGFCWCGLELSEKTILYQFKLYFLCFEITVYWNLQLG